MIAKSYILANLDRLDRLYNKAGSIQKSLFFSKLAIIELCGWIEISMDDIVSRCANRNLRDANNRAHVANSVKRTYGFEYEKHFRGMLIQVVGLKQVERLENRIDPSKFQKMKAALGALKVSRHNLAHTYLKSVTVILDAPSLTKARFAEVYNGLSELDMAMQQMRL
jgi:hypothetical protein